MNDLKENDKPKKTSFFGKVGNFFDKAKTQVGGKIKEMNIPEKAKVLAGKTKDAAISTKVFVSDKSNVFIVKIYLKIFLELKCRKKCSFKNKKFLQY